MIEHGFINTILFLVGFVCVCALEINEKYLYSNAIKGDRFSVVNQDKKILTISFLELSWRFKIFMLLLCLKKDRKCSIISVRYTVTAAFSSRS